MTGKPPLIAQKSPYAVDVEAGKPYFWGSCGQSTRQPFCDGSHKDSEFAPVKHTAEKDSTAFFCGCKQSGKGELCDATHSRL